MSHFRDDDLPASTRTDKIVSTSYKPLAVRLAEAEAKRAKAEREKTAEVPSAKG